MFFKEAVSTLKKIISVIIAGLIFNICYFGSSHSLDLQTARFGGVSVDLPTPPGLCNFGYSQQENFVRSYMRDTQYRAGTKLLGIWADCPSQNLLANGTPSNLKEWTIVTGSLLGDPPLENVLQDLTNKEYMEIIRDKLGLSKIRDIAKGINEDLKIENDKYFKNKNAIRSKDIKTLGILSQKKSLVYGMTQNIKSSRGETPVLAITSTMLIKGIPLNINHYTHIGKNTNIRNYVKYVEDFTNMIVYFNK